MATAAELDLPGSPAELPLAGRKRVTPLGPRPAPVLFAVAGLVLFALYLLQARTVPITSDGAFPALQAHDILGGNLLLRGWSLGDVSYYTTEIPQYLLIELAFGLHAVVVYVAAAMSYTLVVLLAALLAKGRASGREGAVRALVAGGIMLAPAQGLSQDSLLSSVDHTGTQAVLLAIWLVLDRPRPRWWVPVAVAVLLAWAQVADPIVGYEAVLPLVAVCLLRIYLRRGQLRLPWRDRSAEPLPEDARARRRAQGYDLSLAAAAAAAAVVAALAMRFVRGSGGFATAPLDNVFSASSALAVHLWATVESVLLLFGADFFGLMMGGAAVMALTHLIGLALAGWATAVAVRRFRGQDLVVQVLLASLLVLLVSYLLTPRGQYPYNAHEIVGLLPIGAVLAGRLLSGPILARRLVPALLAALACYAGMLVYDAAQPPAVTDQQRVATWLRAHHLTYGLAGYWYASSVTLDSGGSVAVRPIARQGRTLVLNPWEIKASWYDSRMHDATFVIEPASAGSCYTIGCLRGAPEIVYGPPAATYRVGDLTVLLWHKNLLDVALHRIPAQVP